jgi:4-carboxymuconolactone decarboxylase
VIDFLGQTWARGTLSVRDRQLITLAVLVALGSREPLQVHVRNGLKGGLTRDDVYEAILHAGAYAGFARATDAYEVTKDVLAVRPRGTASPAT